MSRRGTAGQHVMTDDGGAPDLDQMARDVLNSIRYVVLGTIDEDGRTRT
jgi:hypothetical protein